MQQFQPSRRRFLKQGGAIALAAGTAGSFASILSACSSQGGSSSSEPVQLTYTYPAYGGVPKDLQAVQDALNVLLKKHINVTVNLNAIEGSAWAQKIQLAFASGQVGDIVFTAPWTNNYYQNVAQENLLALNDLLPKYAPGLYASLPQSIWKTAQIKGKIYGVINQQHFPKTWGIFGRQDLADKYHLNLDNVNSYQDLEPYLAQIKAHEPGITPLYSSQFFIPEMYGWDPLGNGLAVRYDDTSLHVFNIYDTTEYQNTAELMRRWHQMGYVPQDIPPAADVQAQKTQGKFAVITNQALPPYFDQGVTYPIFQKILLKDLLLNTDGVLATLNAVTSYSKHPKEAMQFLELLNTNKEIYNLLCNGIENKHYTIVDKSENLIGYPTGMTSQNDGYHPNTDWVFGNQFNASYWSKADAQAKRWQIEANMNKTAVHSVALGFALDSSSVKTQVSAVSALILQYKVQFDSGVVDPAKALPEFRAKLKAAGIDQIIAETQSQIASWAATR